MFPHDKAMSKAKIGLMYDRSTAFYAAVAMRLPFHWDNSQPTAYTDYKSIGYNTEFFMELSAEERVFLLAHEAMHVALMHNFRIGNRNHKLWNDACDYAINIELRDAGLKLPQGVLYNKAYKGMSAEQIYDLLVQQNKQPSNAWDDLRDSTSTPAKEDDLGLPVFSDVALQEIKQQVQDIVLQAATQVRMQGQADSIPGEIQVFLNKLINPQIPWGVVLQRYLKALTRSGYTWRKRNRRYQDVYLPGIESHSLMEIAVAWDMSGSVSDTETTAFASECTSIFRMMKPKKVTLVQFDTRVFQVDVLKSFLDIAKLKLKGRGGTNLNPVAVWTQENKPHLTIIFTDGQFSHPKEKFHGNVIWLVHNNPTFTSNVGKVIHYTVNV